MNRFNGSVIIDETEHIKQSVADILLTLIGSRIQRRDYGSQIPLLLDRPISQTLLLQLASSAVVALTKWEPRIQITLFKPLVEESKITAKLVARRTDNQQPFELSNLILGSTK